MTSPSDLERAVAAIVRDCMGVREGEEMLVVCNPATIGIAERLRAEAGKLGADAVTTLMAERASHAAEPPAPIAAAMAAADVVLAPTLQSLSHTAARRAATEAGVRIATLPGATEEMLGRVMSADMEGLRRKGGAIADRAHRGQRGADHLRQRLRPSPRPRRARGDPRRRRSHRAGRLRQSAMRRGLHRADRGQRRGHALRRRHDRRDRARLGAGRADDRGRAPRRRHRRRGRSPDGAADDARRATAPTSPSSASAPTRRRS